jgi:hypothetical protein
MSPPSNIVLVMDIPDLLIAIISIPIVAIIAYLFGRNPFRWALYAYFFQFWVLIPLALLNKRPTPPTPKWIKSAANEFNTRRELRELKRISTPRELLSE